MLDDIRQKIQALHKGYSDDIARLIDDLQNGWISGEEYRAQASIRRAKFFEDDRLAHHEMSERVKGKLPPNVPAWLSDPPKE